MDPLRVVLLESMEVKLESEEDPTSHDMLVQQRSIDETLLMSDHIGKVLQKERQLLQEKMYTSWLNYRLEQVPGSPQIVNLFEDLKDGKYLLALLEQLTGQTLKPVKGNMRLHHLNNLAKVFKVLGEQNIKLVGIHNESICDGHVTYTLGLCWSIIYHFQVLHSVDQTADNEGSAEKALLEWCSEVARSYAQLDVKSFQPNRWKTGYTLNALVHSFDSKLFDFEKLKELNDAGRLQHALDVAYNNYGVPKLFTTTDFENNLIDNKTLILYVSMLREQMNIFKENKEKEALTVLERLQGQLDDTRKTIEEKEGSELLNPPTNLPFSNSKTFSGQYKGFLKELDSTSLKLGQLKEAIKSVDSVPDDNLDEFNSDCGELEDRIKAIKQRAEVCLEGLKQSRTDTVHSELENVIRDITNLKTEKEKVSEDLRQNESKEELERCEHACKDMLERLTLMQTYVKTTCSLVDEAYADKTLPKDVRQGLKNEAIKVLEEYANLMVALEEEQKIAKVRVDDKVKTTEEKFTTWSDKVKELETWLDERIHKYETISLRYGDLDVLSSIVTDVKELLDEMRGESWKKFESIASVWNGELCDEINDDKYADVLSDIQGKFNKLHEVATGAHTLSSGMLTQKKSEADLVSELESLNTYADGKEIELRNHMGLDAENVDEFKAKLEGLLKDIEEKDSHVKDFLSTSSILLQENKYDESAVSGIEVNLKAFCDKWDKLKEAYMDKKLRMDQVKQLRLVQRQSERNLAESLIDWQAKLNDYTLRQHNIILNEYNTIEEIKSAIEELELLIAEINGHNETLQEYDRDTSTLIDTLEKKSATELNAEFQKFFTHWEELKAECLLSLKRLNGSMEQEFASEDLVMKEWEDKAMMTGELLKVSDEVSYYTAAPSNLDDLDEHMGKFDDLEVKVNTHVDFVDENIAESNKLLHHQLKIKENKEKVKASNDAFQQKKTNLLETLVVAKKMVIHLVEKRKMQKENEEILSHNLSEWEKTLDDNNETLDRCDINQMSSLSDAQKAIDILEALLAQISGNDDQLSEFDTNSQELLSTLEAAKAAQLNGELRLFFKSWDHCQGKATERLSGLKMQFAHLQKNEDSLMAEWQASALKTLTWLENAIEDTKIYCSLPEEPYNIQDYLSNFQEVQNRVNAKIEYINDLKDHGDKLIENGKVQDEESKEKIQKDVIDIGIKESVVQENISHARKLVDILKERLITRAESERNLNESLSEVQKILDGYIHRSDKINMNYDNGLHDIHTTIQLLQTLLSDFEEQEGKIKAYKDNSTTLINTLDAEQAAKMENDVGLFFKNWNLNKDKLGEILHGLEEKLKEEKGVEELMMADWMTVSSEISDWLDKAEDEIAIYVKEELTNLPDVELPQYHTKGDIYISEAIEKDLVEKLEEEGKSINEQIKRCSSLAEDGNMKTAANREEIEKDALTYTERSLILYEKLLQANFLLDDIAQQCVKDDEIKSTLDAWKKYLDDKKEDFNEINKETNMQVGVKKLEAMLEEVNVKGKDVEFFVKTSDDTLTNNKYNKASSSEIQEELRGFFDEWNESVNALHSSKESLQRCIDEELANEQLIMKEWEDKAMVTEELLSMSEEISVYAEAPGDLDDFDAYLSRFDELESKVTSSGNVVDENIGKGSELLENQVKLEENKEKIKNVVNAFALKKTTLQDNLTAAKKMVTQLAEKRRIQKENEEKITNGLSEWKKILEDNNETLNKCDINKISSPSDTKDAIDILEALLADISNDDERLREFDTDSHELLNALEPEKAAKLNMEIKLFLHSWEHFKDKATERLTVFKNSSKLQSTKFHSNESAYMDEWNTGVLKTLAWLEDAEKECSAYCSLPQDPFDIHKFLSNFEGVQTKVDAKMEYIKEQKDHGNTLIERMVEQENKEQIINNVEAIEEKETAVLETLSNSKKLVEDEIRAIVLKRVGGFWAWLPAVQKRCEEGDEIGPDFETVAKQIQEMKVIQAQAMQMSFSGLLDPYKTNNILDFLSEEERDNLRSANDEWTKVKNWSDKRLDTLQKSDDIWDDFKARKIDLVDYLRDIESELKSVIGLDLNDTVTVGARKDGLKAVTTGMEDRKNHVDNLIETADKLITLLSSDAKTETEHTLPNSIRSQVADISDSWNTMVKKSIELKTKLQAACRKFESLEKVFDEVRDWIEECNSLLSQFTVDTAGVHIDQLRVSLEEKQKQEEQMKEKLHEVNELDDELSRDGEICPQYTLNGNITDLNDDFASTCVQLEELRKFGGRVRIMSRRVRGSTRQLTRNFTTKKAVPT